MKTFKLTILAILTALSAASQVGRELYRPVFHYSPSYNWMSDPNGPVYYNGKYHLFYQYNPLGILPVNMSWGHAVSTDLINWEEKPVAMPVQNGVQVYSGSVVVDWNNTSGFGINGKPPLVAIYTGASSVQDQRIAYSNDEGTTWTNYSGNPVLSMNNNQFRDPKVIWHKESQKWIMVVSQGSYQGIRFYSSSNLKNWVALPGFGPAGNKSAFWECPDLFKLSVDNDTSNMKWVLIHSVSPTAQYFVGDFTGEQFSWQNAVPSGIIIDDFESNDYNSWIATGSSFGNSPALGTGAVSGYLGSRLINSSSPNGTGAQGKLVSSSFVISKKYISFLIGGGYNPEKGCIKLVVNGEAVRSSTGMNENLFKWKNWDVSSFAGQTAHIEIVDSVTGRWGHVNVDHIIQSDIMNDDVNYGQVDYGKDFYAVQSFSDMPDGRRVWLAWINNWNYAGQIPTSPWKGIMSIPREVKLEVHNGQLKLVQKPIEELKILRSSGLNLDNESLSSINNSLRNVISTTLHTPTFKQFELKVKVSVANKNGFSLKFKKSGLQYTEFIFDFINKQIIFDRSKNSGGTILSADATFKDRQVAPLIIEDGFIDLHLFVDNCSAELFAGGGQMVMSNLIFPDSTSNKIEMTSLGDDFIFEEFDIWKLEKRAFVPTQTIQQYSIFKVYPNPIVNNNGITVKIEDGMVGKVTFNLFDITGKQITEFQPSSNSIIIPRNKLGRNKGMYFLRGSDGQTTQTEKLVILGE